MPLIPLLRFLNPWHVYFSTRQRTFLTILTLHRCVLCQVPQKTLPILALVKALQQVNAFLAAALTRVMRAAVPIPAVASASVLQSATVGGSVVGVVGPL